MTIATLLPDETIVGTGHTLAIDADDATFTLVPRTYEHIWGVETVTLPAFARTKSVQINTRTSSYGAFGGAGGDFTLDDPIPFILALRDPASDPPGIPYASWSMTIAGATVTNRNTAQAAINLTQSQIDTMRFGFIHTKPPYNAGGGMFHEYWVKLHEVSIILLYAVIPVVVTGGPSGTVLIANPTLTWTYTGDSDADAGGVQQRYHIKVFTAAQYGAVGFDPATTTATYDSGDVSSSSTSAVIGPLANLTTFKAYVRAAQNVNGTPHWSLWDDGSEFTTDTDPPTVATITATPTVDAVKIRVTRDLAHTDWTHINLERSDDGSVTWRPVRGALEHVAPDDTVTVYDYEHPEGIPLRYRARGVIKSGAAVLSQGDWKATSSPMVWTGEPCGEWLRAPLDPAGAVLVEVVVDEATISTAHRVGLLNVIGRASPVAVWDVPLLPAGTLTTVTRSYADGIVLRDLVRTAPVLLWQGRRVWGHPHRWLVVTDHSVSRHPSADSMFSEYREWRLEYVEVDEPPVLT